MTSPGNPIREYRGNHSYGCTGCTGIDLFPTQTPTKWIYLARPNEVDNLALHGMRLLAVYVPSLHATSNAVAIGGNSANPQGATTAVVHVLVPTSS